MTLATTSSVWRSTGGDQTRTATAGSMVMASTFYVANAAASGANVKTSSVTGAPTLVLPAGAVVLDVSVTETGTGAIDMGFTPLIGVGPGQTTTLGTPVPTGILNGRSIASRVNVQVGGTGGGASLGNVANATNLVVVTSTANTSGSGDCSGVIRYVVPTPGAENV